MRFDEFQEFRQRQLSARSSLLDAAETNVYRALASTRPEPPTGMSTVHRCDLARAWLRRFELPEEWSGHAMVSRGVRHGLGVVFHWLRAVRARLWLPSDVYPVYFELAHAAGLAPASYPTLPAPALPRSPPDHRPEYLLLHSVTKGWLWPRTFGVVLLGPAQADVAEAFRVDPPTSAQLRLADRLLTEHSDVPRQVVDELAVRAERLFERLPDEVLGAIPTASRTCPGNYFFPVGIPAETLQRECGVLAMPVSVFGESSWSGSILTSLADAFGPTPTVAR
ncbi:hypothetical protein [Streptomyces griseus]|uniref:hypothetical protein n=1 Tax=Streptomyces griseus TaxID=1911 RepID=UPI00056C6552|nr:hypothetical protein [Streptomyces griseus]